MDATVDLRDEEAPEVELQVSVEEAPTFVSRTSGSQLMGAVEGAIQKIEQQLRKHKEKVITSHRNSRKRAGGELVDGERGLAEDQEDLRDDEGNTSE